MGSVVEDFLAESGWEGSAALARLAASWPEVVGPDVAAHVASLTAWSKPTIPAPGDPGAFRGTPALV